ncbi:MAG: hypothetical protein KGL35_10945 [Bradyrhizobium sp.]|nr:hypothetical protein [Bradyrhizobium sp.]
MRSIQFGTTNAGTAANVDGPACLPGELWHVPQIVLQNNSGEALKVQLGIVTSLGFVALQALVASVADGDAAAMLNDCWLGEGEFIRAIVTGTANHSKVILMLTALRHQIADDNPAVGGQAPGE